MNGYKYRCVVTDACGTTAVNTDGNATLTVNVKSADPTSATASVNPVCEGESTTLTLNGGGGGTGTTIKWYTNSCGGVEISVGNNLQLNPPHTMTYWARYEDPAPCSYNTACAEVTVTVIPASAGGTAAAVDSSVCSGTAPTINLTGGTGSVTKWQYSSDNFASDVHDVANVTSNLNNAPAITATTYYRAVQQNGSCASANSSVATVTIQSPTPIAYSWRSEADSGDWAWPGGAADYPWYGDSTYFTEPPDDGVLFFDNNAYLDMNNNVTDLAINKLEFGPNATAQRTITNNPISFVDLCGTAPVITNASPVPQTIYVDITGSDTAPLAIYDTGWGLNFYGAIDNNGQDILVDSVVGNPVLITNVVSGGGGLIKTNSGVLTLRGANTYGGDTTIVGGALVITNDTGLGATSGDVYINGGENANLIPAADNEDFDFILNAGRTITIGEYGGTIFGDTSTPAITINGPIVNNAVWAASTDRQFYIKARVGQTITLAGELTGSGDLVKKLPGTLVMNNVNENYTGDIYLDNGTIETAVSDAFGTNGWINLGADASGNNGATILNYTADDIIVTNTINLRGYTTFNDTKSILVNTACDVNFDGTVYLHDNLTLTANGTGTMVFNQPLNKGTGENSGGNPTTFLADNITKNGDGTVTVTNENSYDGTTAINDGTWVVDSGASSANSAHVVDATSDGSALLMGEGTIGALTLQNDGAVSPGDSTGVDAATLTVAGNVDLGGTGGGTYVCDIVGLGYYDCDTILAGGTVAASAAMSLDLPDDAPSGFNPDMPYAWIIATGTVASAANMSFAADMNAQWAEAGADGTFAIESGGVWGNKIVVTYTTPTRVVLYNFTLGAENGAVVARWRTASEARTVGFWLERQVGADWVRINEEIVYAHGENGMGASYALVDPGAAPGGTYVYRLIELENDNGRQTYGPFARTASALGFAADNPIELGPDGVWIRWLSREDEFYRILRSTNLLEGIEGFRPIATGISATPPENRYLDEGAGSIGMYMIQVEEK